MKRWLAALPIICALALAPAAPAGAVTLHDGGGLHVLSVHALDSRLIAGTVSTPALAGTVNVRILLPSGYAAHPRRRYPVLYLLHGTSGGAADWTEKGDAEQTTAGLPLIVVMPDIGQNYDGGSWCANWWNGGARGQPEWETFHIDQLIPWIDDNLRTIATRDGRAIAGLSQGGFCSMSYAARHPDLFITALSFSGAPDIAYDAVAQALVSPILTYTEVVLDGVRAGSIFGPPATEEINWVAHDPSTLAGNLRGMNLFLFTGNGQPGPLAPATGTDVIEAGVQELTQLFHDRLRSLGIPSYYHDYGPGTHAWPYWARDLRESIGDVMADFAHPPPEPKVVTYTSADARYSVYGWQVAMHRAVWELSTLKAASAGGFTLEGSGGATVDTPPVYAGNIRYVVAVHSQRRTRTTLERPAGGRLEIQVPLGPSDTVQEFDGPATDTTVYTTRVTIAPVAP